MTFIRKALRRVLVYGLGFALIVIGLVVGIYYSGSKIPVRTDTLALIFPNWNKTNTVEASVIYDSQVWRADGRTHLTVDLRMPEAVERLKSFLDGGRTEVVACGPQKLFVHSLIDGVVGIDGDLITIDGMMDMELAGVINARDDMELNAAIRIRHDRTTVTATVIELKLGQIPEPMIRALLEQKSSHTYSREQVFDLIAKDLSPEDAAFLSKHRDALDLAIEEMVPASSGDAIHLDAVLSVDEGAVIDAAVDRIAQSASATVVAEILGPNPAQAQFLKDLAKELEKAGKKLQGELQDNSELRNLLTDPNASPASLFAAFTDCEVTF